jgi:hypothetical protein
MIQVPVLLVVFNRPDTALQVIRSIKAIQPPRLYIAADGPRLHKENEAALCDETRAAVLKEINWECEVHTLFRDTNMGCALGVSGAISWFFAYEEMGIILEDDCVPNSSFFTFCEELLNRYKEDERIMQIAGCNIQKGNWRGEGSYYFSRYAEIWGWASWRRAWKCFDFEMKEYDSFLAQGGLANIFVNPAIQKRWRKNFYQIRQEDPPTVWGYRWIYSIWKENGLCIIPNVSFIENIGFDERAVHTKATNHRFKKIKVEEMDSLVHPKLLIPDAEADNFTTQMRYYPPFFTRVKLKLQQVTKSVFPF